MCSVQSSLEQTLETIDRERLSLADALKACEDAIKRCVARQTRFDEEIEALLHVQMQERKDLESQRDYHQGKSDFLILDNENLMRENKNLISKNEDLIDQHKKLQEWCHEVSNKMRQLEQHHRHQPLQAPAAAEAPPPQPTQQHRLHRLSGRPTASRQRPGSR